MVLDGRPVVPTDVRVRPGKDGRSILDVTLERGPQPDRAPVVRGDGAQGGAAGAALLRPGAAGRPAAGTLPSADAEGGGRRSYKAVRIDAGGH